MTRGIAYIVELIAEDDELMGYGICAERGDALTLRPSVYGARSQAHAAAAKPGYTT